MSVRCPDGHDSTEADYCSVCGLAIAGAAAAAGPTTAAPPSATAPDGAATCANCGEPHGPDDVFCENCGFDFASQTLPESEAAVTSIAGGAAPMPALPGGPVGEVLGTVTISTDATHHARMDSEGVLTFPDPPRSPVIIEIRTPVVTIGRAKASRGVHPDIDLASDALEDPAASSRHAVIERKPDGTWWITDLGSTNGTYLGDTDTQLAPDTRTPWAPGTPVLVGAWTRLDLTAG